MKHPVRRLGFTVVEVFLVITLLAIVTALMVVPVQRLAEAMQVRPLAEVVQSSIRRAHVEARQRNETVLLMYHSKSNVLELCTTGGTFIERIPLLASSVGGEQEPVLEVYRLVPEDPEGEAAAYDSEDEESDTIVFHPAGASTPVAIHILAGAEPVRLVMDPFSGEALFREVEIGFGGDES